MGWIQRNFYDKTKDGGFIIEPHKTDMEMFNVVKTRTSNKCACCQTKLPPKSWVFGTGWWRLCLNCGLKFTNYGIKAFEEISRGLKLNKEFVLKNKKAWEMENALAKL